MTFLEKFIGRKRQGIVADAMLMPAEADADLHASPVLRMAIQLETLAPNRAASLLSALCQGLDESADENARFQAAEALSMAVYPKYKFSEYARIFLEDEAFLRYYEKFMDVGNWHSLDRKYALDQLLKMSLHLDGDLAECGVYKGASAYLMCRAHRASGRIVHLFDSFAGLSAPDRRDGDYWLEGALRMPEESLHAALAEFDNYRTYKGWIPERFEEIGDRRFGFLHVDVDLYQPTFDSLAFFYDRMLPGGVILMDDYGFATCPGAKQAADEFFCDTPESIVMLPTGQAFVVKRS